MSKDYWSQYFEKGEIIDVNEFDDMYDEGYRFSAIVLKDFDGDIILKDTKFDGIDFEKYYCGDIFRWLVNSGYLEEIDANRTLYISPNYSEE